MKSRVSVEHRERNIRQWQDAGYAFSLKIFTDVGHGGLAGEHTERFVEEVMKAHLGSLEKASKGADKNDD